MCRRLVITRPNEALGRMCGSHPLILVVLVVSSSLLLMRKLSINGARLIRFSSQAHYGENLSGYISFLIKSLINVYQGPSSSVTLAGNVCIFRWSGTGGGE